MTNTLFSWLLQTRFFSVIYLCTTYIIYSMCSGSESHIYVDHLTTEWIRKIILSWGNNNTRLKSIKKKKKKKLKFKFFFFSDNITIKNMPTTKVARSLMVVNLMSLLFLPFIFSIIHAALIFNLRKVRCFCGSKQFFLERNVQVSDGSG